MFIKNRKWAAFLALVLTIQAVAFQPLAASPTGYQTFSDEAAIIDALAGKALTSRQYTLTLNADLTFEGLYQGQPMRGRWMFIANSVICLDMYTSVHCRVPMIKSGNVTSIRFEKDSDYRQRMYFPNPYPNLWAQYTVSQ
ncbi:MAG: hypothetical protein L3J33_12440 [Rhodobacteraceae bacterium]|nr:hypothetical protein [Paracoccaceae bacterium]